MNKQYSATIIVAILLVAIAAIPSLQTANATSAKSTQNLYIVHIKSGDPKDHFQIHSAQMGVEHALAFKKAGKDVVIFLDVNGVNLIDDNRPKGLKFHYDTINSFLKSGGKVIACDHCLKMNKVNSYLKGVTVDKHPTMAELQKALENAKVVMSY